MKYDDLEKTHDLFDLSDEVPTPIETIEMEGVDKETLEDDLTFGLEPDREDETIVDGMLDKEDQELINKKKEKKSLKDKWKSLPKKKKIIIIVISIILLLVIIGLILFFVLRKDEEENKGKEDDTPIVIIEEDNYRYENGTLVFLDKNKEELGKYECDNKDEKLCFIVNYNDEDEFDGPKNVYEDKTLIERQSIIYKDNYVFLYDNKSEEGGVITLYNISEQKEEGKYTLLKGFSDSDYVILKDTEGKYGAILFTDKGIENKIDFGFEYLGRLNKDANIVVKSQDKYYIYSLDGKALNKGLNYEIKSYNNNYIAINNGGYYVYDYKGNLIYDDRADYIELLDDYAVIINDEVLYIKDYKGNKYNEEGIDLKDNTYNVLNIYDKDKKLIETKKAYSVTVDGTGINISYKSKNTEKNKLINPYEGKLSSGIKLINYFDGKLYIYRDEDKTDLLGSYSCSNKNIIDKNTKELTNCKIAKESFYSKNEVEQDNSGNLGVMPIINEKYGFIVDSIDTQNPTISLYDFSTNKTLVKYGSVDAGLYSKEEDLTFIDVNEIYVMAQNRSNKYGVIKISDAVTGVVAFDYTSLERLKDYYMGKNNEAYVLVDRSGKVLTEKFDHQIVDYLGNYLKTFSNGKYYVSDFKEQTNDNTGYLDITLGDDYYVFITTDYKLGIGKYNDATYKINEDIYVGENYKNNYSVSKNSDGSFTVVIKSSNTSYIVSDKNEDITDVVPGLPTN